MVKHARASRKKLGEFRDDPGARKLTSTRVLLLLYPGSRLVPGYPGTARTTSVVDFSSSIRPARARAITGTRVGIACRLAALDRLRRTFS
eukprot:2608574-Rhodomonas_salina.1